MVSIVDKLTVGKQNDRRIKLSDEDKQMIVFQYEHDIASITQIAKIWNVSKRTIQFILFPERMERQKQLRQERGGSKIYYKKERHTESMRVHRQYKKELHEEGKI